MGFLRFLQYNNAVPIAVSVLLLGAGSAFAASNPDALLSSEQQVLSVDNTYIAGKDLATYTPEVLITGVTEDADYYVVTYDFTTIDIKDYVWQDVTRSERMEVSKAELNGGDLGLYVTARLRDVIANERTYLAQVQDKERRAVSQQVVATTYSGLIGRFLDATTETLPGYTPVVQPRVEVPAQPAAAAASSGAAPASSAPSPSSGAGGTAQIALQVLGNNPARVALRASYIDLGVVLLDPFNLNVGVHTFLNGKEVASVNVDTSTSTAYTVEYRATDPSGGVAYVKRIILVGDAPDPGGAISSSGTPVAPPPPASSSPEPTPPADTAPSSAASSTPAAPQDAIPASEPQAATSTPSAASSTPETDAAQEVEAPPPASPAATSTTP